MRLTHTATPRRNPVELEIAFVIVIILSGIYIGYDLLGEPSGGHPFGHWLGIIGTVLMLLTETLYSIRKRTRLLNRFGPMRRWLALHIVTGIVGPFMVLMHTGLQFRGLAGVTMALTALVVVNGFFGRYLFTTLQRSRQSGMAQGRQAARAKIELERRLALFESEKPAHLRQIAADLQPPPGVRFAPLARWRYRRQLSREYTRIERQAAAMRQEIATLDRRQTRATRNVAAAIRTQRLFRMWHTLHVPLGLALFTSVALHIGAAVYFRAGLFQ